MSANGLEVLLEGLVPEIAYSGEKDQGVAAQGLQQPADGTPFEKLLNDAEMASARWAWDWLRTRPQILINGNKRWNRLELSEALALPEADSVDPAITAASEDVKEPDKGKKPKKTLTTRPRIHPSEDLIWQTLTRHGVDYKRVPALEWACLKGIASARAEGILQSDLRRLVDQDKRSLPKRTDSLARKGYIAKRTVVVQKMKTSRLWLIDFAPPLVEEETCGLDLTPENLSKDLEPVPWHERWTGNNIDMDALGRTVVGVVQAFNVIRYADLRSKMGVSGKRWQMKTLAKNCQRLVDVGVLKYTAASFPDSRKIFKDCLKFVREPSAEEWDKFLATGKKTSLYSDPSRHREPKPNALALYSKSEEEGSQGTGGDRTKLKRIFSGWSPEKPLAQTVFEVIQSAGPEGASNPQVSVATVGYQHRRYLSSYLTRVAETQQPPHLKRFQVVSKLVRTGKTSAYMFSALASAEPTSLPPVEEDAQLAQHVITDCSGTDTYGFGTVRPRAFGSGQNNSLSDMARMARKQKPIAKRKFMPRMRREQAPAIEAAAAAAAEPEATIAVVETPTPTEASNTLGPMEQNAADEAASLVPTPVKEVEQARPWVTPKDEDLILNVRHNGIVGKLQVLRPKSTVTFLRSGRGLKKPVIMPIDDSLDEPAIGDFPGSNEKSITLAAGVKGKAPAWSHVFIFDPDDHQTAALIQQVLVRMKTGIIDEPAPEPAEPTVGQEITVAAPEITVAAAGPAPARGRARGRGGARGRGKKGQALPAGAKPYVCSLCGGAWKNDIGLKYHLEKAQVPCNPNFDPAVIFERARKRRRMSPAPTSAANSVAGDAEPSGRGRRAKKPRKNEKKGARLQFRVRTALRSLGEETQKFRGLDNSNVDEGEEPETWIPERAKMASTIADWKPRAAGFNQGIASTVPGLLGQHYSSVGSKVATKASGRSTTPSGASSGSKALRAGGHATNLGSGHDQRELLASLPTAPNTPSASRSSDDGLATSDAYGNKPLSHTPLRDFTSRPAHNSPDSGRYEGAPFSARQFTIAELPGLQSEYPELPSERVEHVARQRAQQQTSASSIEPVVTSPFVPSSNYDRMGTDAKRRTAQAFDIIQHILENNCGVFPSDKALFYAMTKVFLKQFRNQMPPTWKNFGNALNALKSRNIASVHTHMMKTGRGKLQTSLLLVKSGVDPHGLIASVMKQKMREAYPGVYIPPAFSPTQEELALLQELDSKAPGTPDKDGKPNANGQKFRSRRKIEEIEVFNAPYYTQAAAESKRDPLWIWKSERSQEGESVPGKRTVLDEFTGPSPKRAKRGSYGAAYDDIPVDPNIMGDPMSPSHGRLGTIDIDGQQEPPSLVEAIKAYSLLPARLGGRGKRRLSFSEWPMTKYPPEVGRVKNPGLDSVPGFFSSAAAVGESTIQFASPEVCFLDPNTNLKDDAEEVENAQGGSRPSSRESSVSVWDGDGKGVEQPQTGADEPVEEPKKFRFVWPSTLEPEPKGLWPTHLNGFFEQYDTSFTLSGRMPSQKWLLAQNLPFSAEEMVAKQKAGKVKVRDWVDREYAKFCSTVNQCAAWEQSQSGTAVMLGGSVSPAYIYINVSPPDSRSNNRNFVLHWPEEKQFGLDTLPYEELQDDEYDDVAYFEHGVERPAMRDDDEDPSLKRRRAQKEAQAKRVPGRPHKYKIAGIKTKREHTAYPKTPGEFLRHQTDENEDLDWSSENVRLAAFIVVTTLLGGIDRAVDWGLMLRLMPDQTISQLRHYWCALKKDRQSTIMSLTDKFRRAFLKAYENNEVPPIDFNNVLEYDWKFLIKWTTELDLAERTALPATRAALNQQFTVAKFQHGNREWRDAFYQPQRSIFNKFQDATSESLAFSLETFSDPKPSIDLIVSMAWNRSLCVTPVEAYSAEAVLHKRNSLFPRYTKTEITELMNKGVDELQREGVISKSSSKWSNGRKWRFNTRVLDALEKAAQQDKFTMAVQFKKELDAALRAGQEKIRVTYMTNDGMIMALLNLQANGRVRVEASGLPNVPMGHEPGNYETRKYPKKYMHFRLEISATESYLFDDANPDDHPGEDPTLFNLWTAVKSTPPPTKGPGGAVPVWCDLFGKVDVQRWLKYLSTVLITLASRGSMRAEELVKTVKPVVMVFEAELIMQWAERLGLLKAQLEGCAPAVMEWWWIAVEAQREGLTEGKGRMAAVAVRPRKALPTGRPSMAV
ncbi:hypothetical protein N0V88_001146 [Collariella sp. IMI 366227]|nr:hypothetical protein N0V88_001146 [Collariella sp. IMI 366227]